MHVFFFLCEGMYDCMFMHHAYTSTSFSKEETQAPFKASHAMNVNRMLFMFVINIKQH